MQRAFCLAEDREGADPGIRIGIASLAKHCPQVPVFLFRPNASPDLRSWLAQFPQCEIVTQPLSGAWGWNCKPQALLQVLDREFEEVFWLDSDMLVSRSPVRLLDSLSRDTVGVAEEIATAPKYSSDLKTKGWGLPVGRVLTLHYSSALVRVTNQHRRLLERWLELLADPRYLECKPNEHGLRPPHLDTDQELLTALLGSEEFAHLPVFVFRNGTSLVHGGGALAHSLTARLRGLLRWKPFFIHAPGTKPWVILPPNAQHQEKFWELRRLLQEISPYVAEAKQYADTIDMPAPWLEWRTCKGRCLNAISLGHPSIRGLPITLAASGIRAIRAIKAPRKK